MASPFAGYTKSASTSAVATIGDDEESVRHDLEALLDRVPLCVAVRLREVVWDGDLDGGDYEWCLLGWVARLSGMPLSALVEAAGRPLFDQGPRPIEAFVLEIRRGQVPENDERVARLYEWLTTYELRRRARETAGDGEVEGFSGDGVTQ